MTMMMDGMMDVKTVPGLPGTEVPGTVLDG